jgi:hypothetical protein
LRHGVSPEAVRYYQATRSRTGKLHASNGPDSFRQSCACERLRCEIQTHEMGWSLHSVKVRDARTGAVTELASEPPSRARRLASHRSTYSETALRAATCSNTNAKLSSRTKRLAWRHGFAGRSPSLGGYHGTMPSSWRAGAQAEGQVETSGSTQ